MKKMILTLITGITISNQAFSSEMVVPDNWNYIELARVKIDSERGSDLDGFGVDAKFSLNDIFYLSGTFQDYSSDISEHERYLLGFGARYKINKQLSPYAQIEHVTVDSTNRFINSSINYWMLGVGISGVANDFGYKVAITHYEEISGINKNYSGYYAEIYYAISKQFSMGVELEYVDDSSDLYNYAFRYHY